MSSKQPEKFLKNNGLEKLNERLEITEKIADRLGEIGPRDFRGKIGETEYQTVVDLAANLTGQRLPGVNILNQGFDPSKVRLLVFDLDGTLYNTKALYEEYNKRVLEQLEKELGELRLGDKNAAKSAMKKARQDLEKANKGGWGPSIGRTYDNDNDLILEVCEGRVESAYRWGGGELSEEEIQELYPGDVEHDFQHKISIGDPWWPVQAIACHHLGEMKRKKTSEQVISSTEKDRRDVERMMTDTRIKFSREHLGRIYPETIAYASEHPEKFMIERNEELIRFLQGFREGQDCRVIVATNSNKENAESRLMDLGIQDLVDEVVPDAGKPGKSRELFRSIKEKYTLGDGEGLSIGDNVPNELDPAKKEGFQTAQINTFPGQRMTGVDVMLDNLDALYTTLGPDFGKQKLLPKKFDVDAVVFDLDDTLQAFIDMKLEACKTVTKAMIQAGLSFWPPKGKDKYVDGLKTEEDFEKKFMEFKEGKTGLVFSLKDGDPKTLSTGLKKLGLLSGDEHVDSLERDRSIDGEWTVLIEGGESTRKLVISHDEESGEIRIHENTIKGNRLGGDRKLLAKQDPSDASKLDVYWKSVEKTDSEFMDMYASERRLEDHWMKLFDMYLVNLESRSVFNDFVREVMPEADGHRVARLVAAGVNAYVGTKYDLLKPYAGVHETLGRLRDKGKKLAVLTDAPRGNAYNRLDEMGLVEYFDVIVTRDDTGKTKGEGPEPFLEVLSELGIDAGRTVFVGDWVKRDVWGAQRIKGEKGRMKAVLTMQKPKHGLTDKSMWTKPPEESGADAVIRDIRELDRMIE